MAQLSFRLVAQQDLTGHYLGFVCLPGRSRPLGSLARPAPLHILGFRRQRSRRRSARDAAVRHPVARCSVQTFRARVFCGATEFSEWSMGSRPQACGSYLGLVPWCFAFALDLASFLSACCEFQLLVVKLNKSTATARLLRLQKWGSAAPGH